MSLRHIRIFLAVCDNDNNISRAARLLHISQPSVSVAIRELEEYYHIRLFDRISRKLYLTDTGLKFLQYARSISRIYEDMERDISSFNMNGELRIGASITVGSQFMAGYVSSFKELMPQMKCKVQIGHSRNLIQQLLMNELDFALVEIPLTDPSLIAHLYMEDSLVIVTPPCPPYKPDMVLSADDFLSSSFLLRENGSGTREVFDSVLREKGYEIEPEWEAHSTTAILNAVSSGIGISCIPRHMAAEAVASGKVYAASVKGLNFRQGFYIVHHKDKILTPAMQAFIDIVKDRLPQ